MLYHETELRHRRSSSKGRRDCAEYLRCLNFAFTSWALWHRCRGVPDAQKRVSASKVNEVPALFSARPLLHDHSFALRQRNTVGGWTIPLTMGGWLCPAGTTTATTTAASARSPTSATTTRTAGDDTHLRRSHVLLRCHPAHHLGANTLSSRSITTRSPTSLLWCEHDSRGTSNHLRSPTRSISRQLALALRVPILVRTRLS